MNTAVANLDETSVQLAPTGEHDHVDERGNRRKLLIDQASLFAMESNFVPKVLVDQEHFSYNLDKSSEAFGWLVGVNARPDGLYGRIEWTDKGDTAVLNSRYRFLSPVFIPRDLRHVGGNRFRPMRIDSLGMTNNPNLPVKPLLNRRGVATVQATQRSYRPQLIKNRGVPDRLCNRSSIITVTDICQALEKSMGGTFEERWNSSAPLLNRFSNRDGAVESDALWAKASAMEQDAYDRTWDMFVSSGNDYQAPDRGQNLYRSGLQPSRAFLNAIRSLMSEQKPQFKTPGGVPSGMDFSEAWSHLRETEPVFWLRHVFKMMHPLGTDR